MWKLDANGAQKLDCEKIRVLNTYFGQNNNHDSDKENLWSSMRKK